MDSTKIIVAAIAVVVVWALFRSKIKSHLKDDGIWLLYPVVLGALPLYLYFVPDFRYTTRHYLLFFAPFIGLTMGVLALWFYRHLTGREGGAFEKGPLFDPLLLFLSVNVVSLAVARAVRAGLTITYAYAYIFLSYIAIYNTFKSMKTLRYFVFGLIGACDVLCVIALANFARGMRATSPFTTGFFEAKEFGMILEEVFFIAVFLYVYFKDNRLIRRFLLASISMMALCIVFAFSRLIWLTSMVLPIYMLFVLKTSAHVKRRVVVVLFAFFVVAVYLFSTNEQLIRRFETLYTYEGWVTRTESWIGSFKCFIDHPVLGVGVNNYNTYYIWKYAPRTSYYYQSLLQRKMAGTGGVYLRALAETGSLGFIALAWIFLTIYTRLSRAARRAPEDSFEKAVLTGLLLAHVAYYINVMSVGYVWPIPWFYSFFAMAIVNVVERQGSVEVAEEVSEESEAAVIIPQERIRGGRTWRRRLDSL
jgi:O-antigen ligase